VNKTTGAQAGTAETAAPTGQQLERWSRELVLRDSCCSDRLRYAYVPIGKAANTAIKRLLWECEIAAGYDRPVPEEYFGVHNDGRRFEDVPGSSPWRPMKRGAWAAFLDFTSRPDVLTFSVVRNPFRRLLSGYLDKFVKYGEANRNQAGKFGMSAFPESFEAFVEDVCAQPDLMRNPHWRSQVNLLHMGEVTYDHVGHFEHFDRLEPAIAARFGLARGKDAPKGPPPHSTSADAKDAEHFPPRLVTMIADAYAADFEAFGYAPTPDRTEPTAAFRPLPD